MDTAGKAVLFSGLTVLDLALGGDARAEPGLPLDGARDHALGRLRPRGDADAAAGRAREARPAGRQARAAVGARRRAPLAALRRAGPSGSGAARSPRRPPRSSLLVALACPSSASTPACRRSRSCPRTTLARRLRRRSRQAFGPGAPGRAAGRRAARPRPTRVAPRAGRPTRASRSVLPPPARSARRRAGPGGPGAGPVRPGRRRDDRPPAGRPARRRARRRRRGREPRPRSRRWPPRRRSSIGVVLALGFLLLLVALQAPLIAAIGVRHEPARHRRGVRRRAADLPGRATSPACSASSRRASSTPGGRSSSSR